MKKLLRLGQVRELVGLSRSTIYKRISMRKFPRPVSLGERAVAWDADEVQAWIKSRVADRNAKAAA